jgi:hypothetical protein
MDGAEKIAGGKIALYFFKLMQQLLEPKLVGLMNDDEKHLIVFRRRGARALQPEQLLQIEIVGVGEWRHAPNFVQAADPTSGSSAAIF